MSKIQIAPESQASRLRILSKAAQIADENARRLEGLAKAEEGRAQAVEGQLRSAEMRWQNYANDRAVRRGQATRQERSAREKIARLDDRIATLSAEVDSATTPKSWAAAQNELLDCEYARAVSQADLDKATAMLSLAQAREDLHTITMQKLSEALGPARETAGPARKAADEARSRADDLAAQLARIEAESDAAEQAMAEKLALGAGIGQRAEA